MSSISDNVLNKIKKNQLKPKSKWHFFLRDGGKWFGFGMLIIMAVMFLGLLWYFLSDNPWVHGGVFGYNLILGRMPLIFIGLFFVMSILVLVDFRNIGKGYRYSLLKILLPFILFVLVFGWSVNYFGMSARIDQIFKKLPYYQNREAYMKGVWQNPANGLLAGEIINIIDDKNFVLRDFSNKEWQIDTRNAIWRHDLAPEVGAMVKLIGKADNNVFIVSEVRPWVGSGGCRVKEMLGTCEVKNK